VGADSLAKRGGSEQKAFSAPQQNDAPIADAAQDGQRGAIIQMNE
jgi:hypothetical protein